MIRCLLFFFLAFAISDFLSAQNWECIKTNGQYLFSMYYPPKGASESISIDSAYKVDERIYLQNHTSLRSYDGYCYLPDQPSFTGSEIWIDSTEATYNFLNISHQVIKIYPRAGVGDSWVLFRDSSNNLVFEAYVEACEFDSVLTLEDSVKTFILQATDTLGNLIPHCFNGKKIKLSKNYGIIEIPDLYLFPSCQTTIGLYKIVGIPVPLTGILNIGFEEVYNMEIGDEFHTLYYWHGPPGNEYSSQTISILTGKTVNEDSTTTFTFHQYYLSNGTLYDSADKTQEVDFNSFVAMQLKKAPGETLLRNPNGMVIALSTVGTYNYNGPLAKYNGVPVYVKSGDCFQYGDPGVVSQYIMGCGGPYDSYSEYHNTWGTKLLYYKKGITEWGTPIIIEDSQGIDELEELSVEIFICPNPASHLIKLKIYSVHFKPMIFEIYDIMGNKVSTFQVNNPEIELDISNYKSGVYLYKLFNSVSNNIGKIIKQ